jgi:hypothetical protein
MRGDSGVNQNRKSRFLNGGPGFFDARDTGGYEQVFVERPEPAEPVTSVISCSLVHPVMADPYDIEPAFHMRYEKVYECHFVNLKALRKKRPYV